MFSYWRFYQFIVFLGKETKTKRETTMKKGCMMALAAAVVVVLALLGWCKSTYNNLVQQQESVESAWSQVENVYQIVLFQDRNEFIRIYHADLRIHPARQHLKAAQLSG